MAEPRFFHSKQTIAATPPAVSNQNCTKIQINWNKGDGEMITIQRRPIGMTPLACLIYLKPSRWLGHEAQLALDALDQKIYASKLGRRAT